MEVISLAISLLAIIASVFTYIVHDRRLKRQEILINDYQLRKNLEEEQEQKRAKIRANIVKGFKGKTTLKIYNAGKATARKIELKILEEDKLFLMNNPFPYEFMHPQDNTDLIIHLSDASPDKINVILTWEDDYQQENQHHQILTL